MTKLTESQAFALVLLADGPIKPRRRWTAGDSLRRKGLAQMDGLDRIELTEKGRAALAAYKAVVCIRTTTHGWKPWGVYKSPEAAARSIETKKLASRTDIAEHQTLEPVEAAKILVADDDFMSGWCL